MIGFAPLKWNTCTPAVPPTAKSSPDGDIEILVTLPTETFGMFEYVLVVVRFPELSAVYTASWYPPDGSNEALLIGCTGTTT